MTGIRLESLPILPMFPNNSGARRHPKYLMSPFAVDHHGILRRGGGSDDASNIAKITPGKASLTHSGHFILTKALSFSYKVFSQSARLTLLALFSRY